MINFINILPITIIIVIIIIYQKLFIKYLHVDLIIKNNCKKVKQ